MDSLQSTSLIGFDSAWTDKPSAPGAICAIRMSPEGRAAFVPPELVSFESALAFIAREQDASDFCLVALDQPTIVPNLTSLRPVDRVAASLISWLGGGVQPANRSKIGMFDDAAPIWRFKAGLAAIEDPEQARTAPRGTFLMEVFPALALPSFDAAFYGRNKGPRYNPARRKTYTRQGWDGVVEAVRTYAVAAGLEAIAAWAQTQAALLAPRKAHQDRLDAVLCALIASHWRVRGRSESIMIGDLEAGYMIAPASHEARTRLTTAAHKCGVSVDGVPQREPLASRMMGSALGPLHASL